MTSRQQLAAHDTPAQTVQRYLDALFDPASDLADIGALLHPEVEVVEHPNAVSPHGQRRSRDEALAGVRAGRELLVRQSLDVLHVSADGDDVTVRAVWNGELAHATGPLPAASSLRAHLAMFFTVEDGRILRQTNYDCYEPMPRTASAAGRQE